MAGEKVTTLKTNLHLITFKQNWVKVKKEHLIQRQLSHNTVVKTTKQRLTYVQSCLFI